MQRFRSFLDALTELSHRLPQLEFFLFRLATLLIFVVVLYRVVVMEVAEPTVSPDPFAGCSAASSPAARRFPTIPFPRSTPWSNDSTRS